MSDEDSLPDDPIMMSTPDERDPDSDYARVARALSLLDELAEHTEVECSGPERFVETARGEGTVTGYQVIAMCTAHGEQVRGGLAVDESHTCAHRRAHLLLVEMGIR